MPFFLKIKFNPLRFLGAHLVLISFLTSLESQATQIPIACDSAIQKYTETHPDFSKVKDCKDLFDQCNSLTDFASRFIQNIGGSSQPTPNPSPGIGPDTIDSLIKLTVENRIHNLYLGFDGLDKPTDPADPRWMRGSDILTSTGGFGSCAHTGACNPYCNEGNPQNSISFDINSVLPATRPLPPPTEEKGGHGFVPNTDRKNLFTGLQGNIIANQSITVQASDFSASGVLTDNQGNALSGNVPASGALPVSTLGNAPDGWPIQSFLPSQIGGTALCRAGVPSGQSDIGKHMAHHTTTIGQLDLKSYKHMNFTWNDGSFPVSGLTACDMTYSADFSSASTMAALQTGALVQATWMALDEVVNELRSSPNLLTMTDPQCESQANAYLSDLKNGAEALYGSTNNCSLPLEKLRNSCGPPFGTLSEGQRPDQNDCQKLSLLSTLHSSDFLYVAECEVMARAQKIFNQAFMDGSAHTWLTQLKSYATLGCMHAVSGEGLFTHTPNIDSSACVAIWASCFALAAVPVAGPALMAACIASARGALIPADKCITDTSSTTLDQQIASDYNLTALSNCFPYTYSKAFKSYLDAMGFKRVPIQDAYTSQKSLNGHPSIQIKDCKLTDYDPKFVPATRPQSILIPDSPPSTLISSIDPSLRLPHSESLLFLPIFFSLGVTHFHRFKKKRSTLNKFFFLSFCFLFAWIFGSSAWAAIGYSLRMQGKSVNYCIGKNGILMTGKQTQDCCTYTQGLGLSTQTSSQTPCTKSGAKTDLGNKHALSAQSVAQIASQIQSLTTKTPGSGASTVPSPGPGEYGNSLQRSLAAGNDLPYGKSPSTQNSNLPTGFSLPGKNRSGGTGNIGNNQISALSDSTTQTSLQPTPQATESLSTDSTGGTYSSGGSGSEGLMSNSSRGSKTSVSGTDQTQNISFNQGSLGNSDSTSALGTADPEDYFTRIDLDQDLFKIVHQRYQLKAPLLL